MSFFSHIHDVLDGVINATKKIFTKENADKAVHIAKRVSDLIVVVGPYVQQVAAIAGNLNPNLQIDPKLIAAAAKINTTVDGILTQADDAARKGQLLTLVGEAGMAKLEEMLQTGAVHIGDLTLNGPADLAKIPKDQLDAAAQFAYTMWVKPTLAASGV